MQTPSSSLSASQVRRHPLLLAHCTPCKMCRISSVDLAFLASNNVAR